MKFRTVLVLLSLALILALPLSSAAQTDAPPSTDVSADLTAPDASAATFIVNTASDSPSGTCGDGACTLREAIIEANANGSSKDTINFSIPGDGPHVITLSAALQAITQPVIINGLSEPGAACNNFPYTLKIVINGSGLGAGVSGLVIGASNSEVRGLVVQRFSSDGVQINGTGNTLYCSYIGTNSAGSADLGNGRYGVYINGASNTVERSLISGNNSSGITVDRDGAQIRRNVIGLNADATAKIANGSYGIYVRNSSIQIGGAGVGNVIAGNGQDGIFVESGEGNKIQQNYIGTNSSLAAGLGNGMFGVHVLFGQNTAIGSGNTIAYNNADGVYLPNDASAGNKVTMNSIFGNGDLGIDLGDSGVTPNDGGDPDTGPNGLQNFPALSAVGSDGSRTRVVGSLNSKANQTYRVEFFRVGGCDPSGYGEGRGYLGGADVTTNGSGNASFNVILPASVTVGGSVSATATDGAGNSSEFSQCRTVVFENLPKLTYLPTLFR